MFYFQEHNSVDMTTIFSGLITSKMRIRILMRLFLNPDKSAYLRELADEFDASPSHIKNELGNLSDSGILSKQKDGRQVNFSANRDHPLFNELHSMVLKALGMDQILESIIKRLGELEIAFLVGDYAEGKDTGIIDLILVGNIDQYHLNDIARKTEQYINRKIRTLVLGRDDFTNLKPNLQARGMMLLWKDESPQ